MRENALVQVLFAFSVVAAAGCTSASGPPNRGLDEVCIRVSEVPNGVVARVTSTRARRVERIKKHWAAKQKASRAGCGGAAGTVAPVAMPVPDEVKARVAAARESVETVGMAALKAGVDGPEDIVLVDVREPFEYVHGHIPGAVNIPRGLLEFAIWEEIGPPGRREPEAPLYLYCLKGGRAILAAQTLQQLGVANVFAVDMELHDWQRSGYPLE